ncbi:cytochrome P450 [Kitasatospora sp. NPDC089509]|uniref:cytochrome P450 n=1 Tax=Kitasatospora sp. NPDC089509 TaxID=3364079 RepID=UPI00380AB522
MPDPLAFPATRGSCPFAPAPAYEYARDHAPITRVTLADGSRPWIITRHEDVREVLADHRFSADVRRPGFPFPNPGRAFLLSGDPGFVRMDDPEHARQRRKVAGWFTVRRTEALRPRVQETVDVVLDRMVQGGQPADLVADFTLPVPSLVICLMLGVPYEGHAFFQRHSRTVVDYDAPLEATRAAWQELGGYLTDLAEAKLRTPDEGVLSHLVNQEDLTPVQAATTARLLLLAGHETTAHAAALSVLALLREPEQLAYLRARPEAVRGAVDELLRYTSVVGHTGTARVAVEDVPLGDVTVRAGEGVLCLLPVANRDPKAFPAPDLLDVTADSRRHLAFGHGVHLCLGHTLARTELQLMLTTLLQRLPGLRLAVPFEELRYRDRAIVQGLESLPVAW